MYVLYHKTSAKIKYFILSYTIIVVNTYKKILILLIKSLLLHKYKNNLRKVNIIYKGITRQNVELKI